MNFTSFETYNDRNIFDVSAHPKAAHYILEKRVYMTSIIDGAIDDNKAYLKKINDTKSSRDLYKKWKASEELVTVPESIAFARFLMNEANGGTQKYSNFDYSKERFWEGHELTGIIGEFVFYFWSQQYDAILSTDDLRYVALERNIKGVNDKGDFEILFGQEQNKIIDVKTSKSPRPYMSCNVKKKYRYDTTAPKIKTGIQYYVGIQWLEADKYWIVGYTTEEEFFKQRNWRVNMSPKSRCFQIHYEDLRDCSEILK